MPYQHKERQVRQENVHTWMQGKRTRWRDAISLYIWSTAPLRVVSRYSLYMLW